MSKILVSALLATLGGLLNMSSLCAAQTDSSFAIAVPLKGIVIDGKLGDWPAGLEKHWMLHSGQVYGPTDVDDADLKTSKDLSPSFMVGYSPEENLLYVAVTVRDDIEMAGNGVMGTDGIEVYVEGRRERKTGAQNSFAIGSLTALQYTLCPPGGSYDTKQAGQPEPKNPRMFQADITKTRAQAAYSRQGDISIYEFAIEAFDRFPDAPTKLLSGKIIGLDVVSNDVDSTGAPAWVCWGTFKPFKFFNADTLGDVLIADDPAKLGTVSGVVSESRTKGVFKGFEFEMYRAGQFLGCYKTDDAGTYSLKLPAGAYEIKPRSKQGVTTETAAKITVNAGGVKVVNFTPKPVILPPILVRSAAAYHSITGYRDSTIISVHTKKTDGVKDERYALNLAFERPNKLRFECLDHPESMVLSQYSDGTDMTAILYLVNAKRFMRTKAPDALDIYSVDTPVWQAEGNMLDLLFLINEDPLPALTKNTESIREIGKSTLEGEPVTGVEIIKNDDRFICKYPNMGAIPDMPRSVALDTLTIWFGNRDALIRKISFRLDVGKFGQGLPAQMPAEILDMFKGIANIDIRHNNRELNPSFAEKAFVFEPPADAMEMRMSYEPATSTAPKKKELAGKPAPDFTLKDVDGKETGLADCRDCVVVLDFWASLNDPSVQTLEMVQKIHQKFDGKNVRVIGINEFEDEDPDPFRSFLKEHGISCRILKDTEGTMVEKYGFTKIPACFVIDRKGIVRQVWDAKPGEEELATMVRKLLGE